MHSGKIKNYLLILKYIFLAFIFFNTFQTYSGSIFLLTIFWIFTILLAVNDTIRTIRESSSGLGVASLLISIIGAAVIKYYIPGIGSTVYIFVPLFELFYLSVNRMKILIAVHALAYFTVILLTVIPFNTERISTMGISILLYLGVACMSYLLHSVQREKEEVKKLNMELTINNNKLKEYSRRVEELTITAERSRVAQELHDSLGHSLMALSMNLEYAEKISDSKPEQVKKILLAAKEISKESISNLRNAVSALRDEPHAKNLAGSINELIGNFSKLERCDIHFSMDKELEETNIELKNCIYKTIREGLTNGLRHGKATIFNISAQITGTHVRLVLHDNGSGCDEVIESVGLKGINERIAALGGNIHYNSCHGGGFEISAELPVARRI